MNDWKKFYEESLYPLQNGIMNCVKDLKTLFYLTGGTALSRGYYNHRYSDDLDFFVNNDNDFRKQAEAVIASIESNGFNINKDDILLTDDFITFFVSSEDYPGVDLKIDLVNDIAERFGELKEASFFPGIDNWRNILSNKLCSLLRLEIKDFVDLWIISINEKFNWDQILREAREKEMGLDPAVLADLIKTIPEDSYNTIKWVGQPPSYEQFMTDSEIIVFDMLRGNDNSLSE